MNRGIRWTLCAMTTVACVASLGCDSSDKDTKKDRDRIARRERNRARRDNPDPVIARDRGPRGSANGLDEIPSQAVEVDGGLGSALQYEPSRDGVLYVYDADDGRVIYVGRIRDRERFRLDPDAGRGLINSRTVFRSDLNPRHRYRLYFERAN